jgi:hypothetical protein
MPKRSMIFAGVVLVLGVCALVEPVAVAERVVEPASDCRFTLERGASAGDGGEIWLLTCHRQAEDRTAHNGGMVRRVDEVTARPAADRTAS